MDEKPSFVLKDVDEKVFKPLPYNLGKRANSKVKRVKLLDYYPKYEAEFYEVVAKCAEYIDKIRDVDQKIKYSNDLNRIFILRRRDLVMRVFRELVMR